MLICSDSVRVGGFQQNGGEDFSTVHVIIVNGASFVLQHS